MNTTQTTIEPGEKLYSWNELNPGQQKVVVLIHAHILKAKSDDLMRLFELGKPRIVFGPQHKYCRVYADDVQLIKVLTNTYL